MAKAEDVAPIDFLLEYSAEQGCPDGSTFEAALRARLPAARRVAASETSEATPLIRIRLPAAGTAQTREISAELPDGTRFLREVPDAACVDAMQSMAVIAAMALEGNQRAMNGTSPAAATRLSGWYAQSSAERFGAADVRFRLLAGRLDFCPTRAHSRGWGVAACAEVEAGELRGSADHVAQRRDQTMPWLGLGVVGRAEVALSRSFALELGVSAELHRYGVRSALSGWNSPGRSVPAVRTNGRLSFARVQVPTDVHGSDAVRRR